MDRLFPPPSMNIGSWRKVHKLAGSLVKIKSQSHGKTSQRHHIVKRRRSTKSSRSIKQQERVESELKQLQALNAQLLEANEDLRKDNEFLTCRLRYAQDEAEVLRLLHTTAEMDDSFNNAIGPLCPGLVEETGKRVGDYKLAGILGRGAFAHVCMGRPSKPETSNQEVAIKVFNKSKIQSTDMITRLKMECGILRCHGNSHPNIIGFHGVMHGRENIYLVMEKAQGSLIAYAGQYHRRHHHQQQQRVQADFTQQIMLGVLRALAYLHERGISHGDIDPQNILIRSAPGAKVHHQNVALCDFGFATDDGKDDLKDYQMGKANYLAPELAQRQKEGSRRRDYCKADMFSLGATGLWCLTSGATTSTAGLWDRWCQCYEARLSDPSHFQTSIANLVEEMRIERDPKILGSESDQEFDFLVNGLLHIDVDHRLTSASALAHPWFQHQLS